METKICSNSDCGKELPIDEFRLKRDGTRNRRCNGCSEYFNTLAKKRYKEHFEQATKSSRKFKTAIEVETLDDTLQRCRRCKNIYPKTFFGLSPRGRVYAQCPACRRYETEWIAERRRTASPDETSKRLQQKNESNRKLRADVLGAYGNKCSCCGENHQEFLAVDHIKGGGRQHRAHVLNREGTAFYRWLRAKGFPQDGFRLLCHNCNVSLGMYGYCPHKPDERVKVVRPGAPKKDGVASWVVPSMQV